MKKTTLISTLAMVVIVALALTTATFAWYTSNNTVKAKTTATAAATGTANLGIHETATTVSDTDPTTITLAAATLNNTAMLPAAPKAKWVEGGTDAAAVPADADAVAAKLFTANVGANGSTYTADGSPLNATDCMKGSFNVINRSPDATPVKVTLTVAVTNQDNTKALATGLKFAIFQESTYKGVISTGSNVTYGEINKDGAVITSSDWTVTASVELDATAFTPNTAQKISFVAWFDGAVLGDTLQGAGVDIEFTINGSMTA